MQVIAWLEGPEDVIDGATEGALDLAASHAIDVHQKEDVIGIDILRGRGRYSKVCMRVSGR
jgi:hypothetical protein